MKKIFITLLTVTILHSLTNAQKVPLGSCGIQYTYDKAGNQIKREYLCNNGPQVIASKENNAFQLIDALTPNPTTGRFSVTFSKALNKADILIADASGRTVIHTKGNGNKIDFDISTLAAGFIFCALKKTGGYLRLKW